MSINVFLVTGIMICCLAASYTRRGVTGDAGITNGQMKKDTVYRAMTPLRFLEFADQKKVAIVFSESPRFFYIWLTEQNNREQTRAAWNKWITGKTKLRIGFTEDQDRNAIILTVKE